MTLKDKCAILVQELQFKPDAQFNLPVYLDQDVQSYLADKAASKGVALTELVNSLLKKDIELIEAAK